MALDTFEADGIYFRAMKVKTHIVLLIAIIMFVPGSVWAAAIGLPKQAPPASPSPVKVPAGPIKKPIVTAPVVEPATHEAVAGQQPEATPSTLPDEANKMSFSPILIGIGASVAALLAVVAGGGGGGNSSTPRH